MGESKNLKAAKAIIQTHYKCADCGIFDTQNILGDPMETIYAENGLTIDICYPHAYFEVFGLSPDEFKELKKFYYSL